MKRKVVSVLSVFVACCLFYSVLNSFVLHQTYDGSTVTCGKFVFRVSVCRRQKFDLLVPVFPVLRLKIQFRYDCTTCLIFNDPQATDLLNFVEKGKLLVIYRHSEGLLRWYCSTGSQHPFI